MKTGIFICPSYPSKSSPYACVWLKNQIDIIRKHNIFCHVVAPVPYVPPGFKYLSSKWTKYLNIESVIEDDNLMVHRPRYFTHPKENRFGNPALMQMLSLFFLKFEKPDFVHSHFALPQGILGESISKKYKIPAFLTLHGDDITVYPYMRNNIKKLKKVVHSVDELFSVSQYLTDQCHQLTNRKAINLPIGIDLSHFKKRISVNYKNINIPPDTFVVTFIGNLNKEKGVCDLLDSFRELKNHNVFALIVGDGVLKNHLIQDNIKYLGAVPNTDIPEILSLSDLLVLPSHREGLGQVILEAGAVETPVLGANTGGIIDLLNEGRGYIFPKGDVKRLSDEIINIKNKKYDIESSNAKLKKHIIDNYCIYKNTTKLIEYYNQI